MVKLSNTESIYTKIKTAILTCDYEPGQLVSEKELVERFGTSRTPVREALSMLSGQGLVDILPKKGIQISKLSVKNLLEVYELRRLLEPLTIKYALQYITDEDIVKLQQFESELKDNVQSEDVFSLFKAGMDFHLYIAHLSHNETLFNMLKILREESYRGLTYYLRNYILRSTPAERKEILNFVGGEHSDIIAALKNRDAEAAVNAMIIDLDGMTKVIRDSAYL